MSGARELADALAAWQDSGGQWRVVHRDGDEVTVELLSCTDEPMDRVVGLLSSEDEQHLHEVG